MKYEIVYIKEGQEEWFLAWSDIVDAPVCYGRSDVELLQFFKDHDVNVDNLDFMDACEEATQTDHSSHWNHNRAGQGETSISRAEIIEKYCRSFKNNKLIAALMTRPKVFNNDIESYDAE